MNKSTCKGWAPAFAGARVSATQEEAFTLPTGDGFAIHGVVTRAKIPAGKLVVFCHGLGGNVSFEGNY